jgi:nucleotidyltransferase/DNA polymerase involved in DNA repair
MMLEAMRDLSPKVEYYSIDEFFFEAVSPPGGDYQELAVSVRDRVMERVRVPVTVGIARTRTLAKLISDAAKPFGALAILDPAGEESLLAARPVTDVTGIAGRRQRRLQPWGIRTCLDLARADRRLIRQLLTASGEALWWELNGDPVLPIRPQRLPHKVLSRGGSFGEPTDVPAVLWAWLVRNLERLVEELVYHRVLTGRVAVWVGYRDGRAGEGRATLVVPSDRFDVLLDTYRPCQRQAWVPRVLAARMHLFAEDLRPHAPRQLGLFDDLEAADAATALKRAAGDKHGRFSLRSAATLPLGPVYADRSNDYDICDVHGKSCF